jgi:hypothetical protein
MAKTYSGKITVREWVKKHHKRFQDSRKLIDACVKELKVVEGSVKNVLGDEAPHLLNRLAPVSKSQPKSRAKTPGNNAAGAMTRDNFKNRFDEAQAARIAIRKGLEALTDDDIVPEATFKRDYCQLQGAGWSAVVTEAEFLLHQFRCGGKTWWATAITVNWAMNNVRKTREVTA